MRRVPARLTFKELGNATVELYTIAMVAMSLLTVWLKTYPLLEAAHKISQVTFEVALNERPMPDSAWLEITHESEFSVDLKSLLAESSRTLATAFYRSVTKTSEDAILYKTTSLYEPYMVTTFTVYPDPMKNLTALKGRLAIESF